MTSEVPTHLSALIEAEYTKYFVIDIDGTIANCENRLYHIKNDEVKDWDSFYNEVGADAPMIGMIAIVLQLSQRYIPVFCTGRPERVREATRRWIQTNLGKRLATAPILMRPDGDHRPDHEVKPELLKKFVGEYLFRESVAFILEDRSGITERWRELGFRVLQVAKGDY